MSDDFDDELRDMARRALASIEITKTVPTPQWAARIARGNEVTVQENAEYQLAETLGLTPGASDATGLMLGARTRIERLQAETDLVAPLIEAVEDAIETPSQDTWSWLIDAYDVYRKAKQGETDGG